MKILVGTDIGTYTFNAAAKQITLSNLDTITLSQILLIVNATSNVVIYSPVAPGRGGSITSNVITLDFDTTTMSNSDVLQIYLDYNKEKSPVVVKLSNGQLDAFSRIRVSQSISQFESGLVLDAASDYWETELATGGTILHLPNESSVQMTVTGTSGSRVVREQHGYNQYTPGKSIVAMFSFLFGTPLANVRRRAGYYSDRDGVFIQEINGALSIVKRTYVTGTAVDTVIPQSSWNIDKLDGTGRSGKTIDPTKIQIGMVDMQWLGAGRWRIAFIIQDSIYYAHEMLHSNMNTTVSITSASLPIRYEIESIAASAGGSMLQICSSVDSEGGRLIQPHMFSASTGITGKTIGTTRNSVVSVRMNTGIAAFNRSKVKLASVDILTTSNTSFFYEVIIQRAHLSQTNLGGAPTWNDVTGSVTQAATNGTTVTGGVVIQSGFLSATTNRSTTLDLSDLMDYIAVNRAGNASDFLHLCATALSGTGTVYGTINFLEERP